MATWPWFAWAILGGIGLVGLWVALWRAERILKIKGMKFEIDKTGAKVATDEADAQPPEVDCERLTLQEVESIASGAHECIHDEDFKHFARMLEAVAGLLSNLVAYTLDPEAISKDQVVEKRAVLDMRLKDYRGYLESQGVAV
jgi:hypothetical protein